MISKRITLLLLLTILPHTIPQECTYSDAEWYSIPSNFVYNLQPSNANCQVYSVRVDTAGGWIYSLIKTEFSSTASVVLRKTDYYRIISDTFSSSLLMSENAYTINVLYTDIEGVLY